ncbi:hypothetical protein GCM10010329_44070 [Streptomyces spiroverticillatus]|uniref:Uncharacterized protein n=1 Tax=Streptomyces finlayi TaxID=67296 RepID=A0A918WZR1_9ACTN|nr:hypothetical protein [Streptomyces finlayi]GHA16380.1 hypothetical protein GCM10010329_44070 [Streptomyces spiroverticillatus]GHC98640.1 hypothetical protein GCM10010334_41250 [Streptomyces finlayi]
MAGRRQLHRLVALALGWLRARRAVEALADLVESSMVLYASHLAEHLGTELPQGYVTPAVGALLLERIRKGA